MIGFARLRLMELEVGVGIIPKASPRLDPSRLRVGEEKSSSYRLGGAATSTLGAIGEIGRAAYRVSRGYLSLDPKAPY